MPERRWTPLEPDVPGILAAMDSPLEGLAQGDFPALVIRQAFPAAQCRQLVDFLIEQQLMFPSGDPRIDEKAIPADRADRFTQPGLNPQASSRRRIDIGTSLGNFGDDPPYFFSHAAETQALFGRLFAARPNPIEVLYAALQQLVPGKRVITACEPGGPSYGPAIFRIHYGGYTYGPHFDSVRNRENRTSYAVHKYAHQLAGVLCIQNTTQAGVSAQGIIHRQAWTPEVDPFLKQGRFYNYASQHNIERAQIDLEPGDLYFFNTGMIHEVPGVPGDLPRIVLATFIGYSDDEDEVMVWS